MTTPDTQGSADHGGGPACSASGVATSCDPVANTGCGAGSACYVVAAQGPSCVCPPGTAASGDPCDTTAECAPKNVCAGTQAPGTCRPTCDTAAPDCPTDMECIYIQGFPDYGFCQPK